MPTIVEVTPENVREESLFCIKDFKTPGAKNKERWFRKRYKEGLRIKIIKGENGKAAGFIEYMPADDAWRPVNAPNYMFIHCMFIYSKKDKGRGFGTMLIKDCEKVARSNGMNGVCVMTSNGTWIAGKEIFERNGYTGTDSRGRFELHVKKFKKSHPDPMLFDWESKQKKYKGWHLLYGDQCPYHEKSVAAILNVAMDHGIDIKVKKLTNATQAKNAPSGYGVFSLIRDGKLLEDHYISETRFRNILKKELS